MRFLLRQFAVRSKLLNARERGAAIYEMVVVLPLMLFIASGVVDYGRALNRHGELLQVARFSSVVGARSLMLEENVVCVSTYGGPPCAYTGHHSTHDRAWYMINRLGLQESFTNLTVRTTAINNPADPAKHITFTVEISGDYQTLLLNFISLPIKVSITGGYSV
ncbi:MAG: pilus assembly protein [Bdellovibrionales bacterium]|nr:pilus assembly protein [Bdellovibrionales bacterium]